MKNFAEEITYWYFRLNGFFLLDNYVSHKSDSDTNSHADNDLIGIRPINVKEVIGIHETTDICSELRKVIPEIGKMMIGIICEVKGGQTSVEELNLSKIKSCIKRLGLLREEEIEGASKHLAISPKYENGNISIRKILASGPTSKIPNWERIEIDVMIKFIKERIMKYDEKSLGWNHYDSALIQYLLYEQRKN